MSNEKSKAPGDDDSDVSEILSEDDKKQLISEVRAAGYMMELLVSAHVEGAILGAEQVQDMRITHLENPVASNLDIALQVIFIVALGIVLPAVLPAVVGSHFLAQWIRASKMRYAFFNANKGVQSKIRNYTGKTTAKNIAKAPQTQRVSEELPKAFVEAVINVDSKVAPKDLSLTSTAWRAYIFSVESIEKTLPKLSNDNARTVIDAGTPIVNKVVASPVLPDFSLTASPGVSFLTEMYDWATHWKIAVRAAYDSMELMLLLCDEVTVESANDIRATICRYDELDVTSARHEMMLLSEAMIWARIYNPKTIKSRVGPSTGRSVMADKPVSRWKLEMPDDKTGRLYEYFIKRFGALVARFRKTDYGKWKRDIRTNKDSRDLDFAEYFKTLNEAADKALELTRQKWE